MPHALLLLLLLLAVAPGCAGDCTIASAPGGQPLGFMAQYTADVCLGPSGAEGLAVAITTPDGNLGLGAAGVTAADGGAEVEEAGAFRVGPLSEFFVAVLVLRLVDQGRLDLDAVLTDRVPTAVTDEPIALRHLLAHRSGLKDYTKVTGIDLAAASAPLDLLTTTIGKGTTSSPGDKHVVSATNYLALGVFLEELLGKPWGEGLHEELLDPFGLGATFVDGYDVLPDGLAAGHNGAGRDTTDRLHPANAHAALGIVTNTTDLDRLLRLAFEDDTFLTEESRLELRFPVGESVDDVGFGFGVAVDRLDGEVVWRRDGVHPGGYGASFVYRPDLGVLGIALGNSKPSNLGYPADLAARFGVRAVEPDEEE